MRLAFLNAIDLPYTKIIKWIVWALSLIGMPLLLAYAVLGLRQWDLSVPLLYGTADHVWQLTLNKMLYETGWVLTNPNLGAPGIASWHHNAAAQTSALHSVLMLVIAPFVSNAVQLQQIYYLLNFPLICTIGFWACRLLNIAPVLAFCVGILFSFTKFRIDEMLYSYIPNYFAVPLALVAVIWTLNGQIARPSRVYIQTSKNLNNQDISTTKKFWLGLGFVALIAFSDGYYSFFTLMLLGFSMGARTLMGDWRQPKSLLPGVVYIVTVLFIAVSLQVPLFLYKKNHLNEFYPNGIADSALIKQPFEAEVYSSSLKLLLAPNQKHHVELLGKIGEEMVTSSEKARLVKRGNYWPLGSLGAGLLLTAMLMLAIPSLFTIKSILGEDCTQTIEQKPIETKTVFLALIFFSFLASISGGIGTIVALIFPTIRAYDRFPVFLIFLLFAGAAKYVTVKLSKEVGLRKLAWILLTCCVTALALYDQIPSDSRKGSADSAAKFNSEKYFIVELEKSLPKGSMIYQYPYSQYLTDNNYYGWGSFAYIRLYLHSKDLRWSNGGAKNSPADEWNRRVSQLDLPALLIEAEGVGFAAMVIDRSVVKPAEFAAMTSQLERLGYQVRNDEASRLAYVRLKSPGYTLIHDASFTRVDQVKIVDRQNLQHARLSRDLEPTAFWKVLQDNPGLAEISMISHPEAFTDPQVFVRGNGTQPVLPITDMKGALLCNLQSDAAGDNVVSVRLSNQSGFDWHMGDGKFPMGIGMHVKGTDGTVVRWDDGFRLPVTMYLPRGDTKTLQIPASTLRARTGVTAPVTESVRLELVQDGNAWFNNIACDIRARP